MLVTESRPRNLKWIHAGPLLYGDWGTSRLYVLGLAFLYTAHASIVYLAAIGLLMLAVSWAYTIICRCFPDGGGVYTAARQLSPTLSVVGSTLLLAGYIMTAAISAIEAFHYFHVPSNLVLPLAVVAIILVGGVNWLGAKSAGKFALIIALVALGVSAVMAVMSIPYFIKGIDTISFDFFRETSAGHAWVNFTKICLALAGVEAVANMTGLMKQPVDKEAKKTIWPVSIEVVGLNLVFGLALAGLSFTVLSTSMIDMHEPDEMRLQHSRSAFIETLPPELADEYSITSSFSLNDETLGSLNKESLHAYETLEQHEHEVEQYTNASMRVIATETATNALGPNMGNAFGTVAGITFGLLLLSATNTAVMAMVSVFFAMANDNELPKSLTKLNYSGVPWVGLIASVIIPIAVILVEQDVTVLASLYVLGVTGAITVTVLSSAYNRDLDIGKYSRIGMWILGLFLFSISMTIAVTQPISTAFSGTMVALALGVRTIRSSSISDTGEAIQAPGAGWLKMLQDITIQIDPNKPKLMLAARGRYQSEYAVDIAKRRDATLFCIFVRPIRVMDLRPGQAPRIETDDSAQEALGTTAMLAKEAGVNFVPIYVTSQSIAEEILDHTVTYGCDTLIMGKSRRSLFSRKLEGDVVSDVSHDLPEGITLITRAAEVPHAMMPPGMGSGHNH
ncbi:MAG: universal stress protein [Phycisphaerales bacterium]|nr:universal stress protein [Phycisphaerales bacterium]